VHFVVVGSVVVVSKAVVIALMFLGASSVILMMWASSLSCTVGLMGSNTAPMKNSK